MISHAWSVVCDKVIIDRESNNVSMDVVEQIKVHEIPPAAANEILVVPTKISVVSMWYRDDPDVGEKARIRVRLMSPDGTDLTDSEIDVDLSTHERFRTVLGWKGLPTKASGRYYFVVEIQSKGEWTETARVPLRVVVDVLTAESNSSEG